MLNQVHANDRHVVAAKSFVSGHLLESRRADLIEQFVVDARHIFSSLTELRQHTTVVLDDLITRFTVPNAVTSQYHELYVLMQWNHLHVRQGSDHVVVEVPIGVCVLWRSYTLVFEVTYGS